MAATGPAFGQGPLFNNSFWKSLSTNLDRQPWKSVGAASALTLGLSLTVASKAPVSAEKKNAASLQKVIMAGLMDTRWPSTSNYDTLLASLSLGPGEDWVEPKTGVVFPGVSPDGKRLTGIGLRKKRVFGLKDIIVYTYGLYADPDSLKSTLSTKYDNSSPADLSNKEVLFTDVTKSDVGLTVRLVIVYGKLKIGSIRSAFEESVGKGLKKFSGDDNTELLKRFTSIFTDDMKLPKGTCIDISRLPDQLMDRKLEVFKALYFVKPYSTYTLERMHSTSLQEKQWVKVLNQFFPVNSQEFDKDENLQSFTRPGSSADQCLNLFP